MIPAPTKDRALRFVAFVFRTLAHSDSGELYPARLRAAAEAVAIAVETGATCGDIESVVTDAVGLGTEEPRLIADLADRSSLGTSPFRRTRQRIPSPSAVDIQARTKRLRNMIEVVIIGPNLLGDNQWQFHLHVAGCPGLADQLYDRHSDAEARIYELGSLRDATLEIFSPNEFRYVPERWRDYAAYLKIFDCVVWPQTP